MSSVAKTSQDVSSIYRDGAYLEQNEDWHCKDSLWKANHILDLLRKNEVSFQSAVEVGCGAGKILHELSQALPDKIFTGFDISPQAASFWEETAGPVRYTLGDFNETDESFDLLLAIDVFEHVPDYMTFLKQLSTRAKHFVFHVPLDMNMLMLAKNDHLELRKRIGHLHYFSRATTEATLQDSGYRIVDWFYTPELELPANKRRINPLRKLLFRFSPDFAVKVLGGWSMMILAVASENPS